MMTWLDAHPSVSQWASEELIVWYADPVSGNPRRYFPDFIAEIDDKIYMLEVKPFNQTQPSKAKDKDGFSKNPWFLPATMQSLLPQKNIVLNVDGNLKY